MELRQELTQKLKLTIAPQLITAQSLLHCSNQELEQAILHEMEENPALDWQEQEEGLRFFTEPLEKGVPIRHGRDSEEEVPPVPQLVDGERAFKNDLIFQSYAHVPREWQPLTERLIEQLEPNGYLLVPLEELAEKWNLPLEDLEQALKFLQKLEPKGVGARTPAECLLLQLELFPQTDKIAKVREMLTNYWDDFLHVRFEVLEEKMQMRKDEIEELLQWIQKNLTLYPGYRATSLSTEPPTSLQPDIVIREEEGEFVAEVLETRTKPLCISPLYYQLFQELKAHPEKFSEKEKEHILHFYERTKNFLRALESRRTLLQNVAKVLIRLEKTYFQTRDKRDIPPLTQGDLARECGLSESTISRAVAHKNIQLPWGTVVPISYFLSPTEVLKEKLLRLLLAENPESPYSDQKIANIFQTIGIKLARRTVAKYREELNIPSAAIRKRLGERWKAPFLKK